VSTNKGFIIDYLNRRKNLSLEIDKPKQFGGDSDKALSEIFDALSIKKNLLFIEKPENRATIGVETIKEVLQFASQKPHLSTKSILIIMDFELITIQAQNKLLKIIEEPPVYLHTFLATENEHQVLATIKSRCETIYLDQENNLSDEFPKCDLEEKEIENLKNICKSIFTRKDLKKNYLRLKTLIEEEKKKHKTQKVLGNFTKIVKFFISQILKKKSTSKKLKDKKEKISLSDSIDRLNDYLICINEVETAIKFNVNYKLILDKIFFELFQ
jgi:hypothetical protein